MTDKEPIILPEKYYLDYFNYLIEFVQVHYQHVLDEPEYVFIQEFNHLTEDAQCLYLRFSNRRGDFFRLNKISYPEIKSVEAAKEELFHQGFININQSVDLVQFNLFTKAELVKHFDFLEKNIRKAEMLEQLAEADLLHIQESHEIAEVQRNHEVEFLKLLFFGNRYNQMTEFVIRDIGNIQLKTLDESKFKPWFQSREEAIGVMHLSQLKRMIRELIKEELPLEDYLQEMPWPQWMQHAKSKESADKLLLEIGSHFERAGKWEEALSYFSYTDRPPSNERKVRLLQKLNRLEEANALARKIEENPYNATEYTFAIDFLNRSGIRINRSMTRRLQSSPVVRLSKGNDRVEKVVINHFKSEGWEAIHSENFIWRNLFGLIFWNELFNEEYGAFHHPLQRQPSDLHGPMFYESRKEILEQRLTTIKSKKGLIKYLHQIHTSNAGMANPFVYWHEDLMNLVEIVVNFIPLKGLKQVMHEMSKLTKENSTGFPDLFIWNDTSYHFYEIKSPNDHLSAQQLFWLDFLASAGIKADILRVNYL